MPKQLINLTLYQIYYLQDYDLFFILIIIFIYKDINIIVLLCESYVF